MTSSKNPETGAATLGLSFISLGEHITSDKSFLSSYARALAAIATSGKAASLADFAALTEVARNSQYSALMGGLILQSLEQGVDLDRVLEDLSNSQRETEVKECEAAFQMAMPLLLLQGHHARPLAIRLADALKCRLSPDYLAAMPVEEEALGFMGSLGAKARRLVKGKSLADFLVDFGKSVGDLELIGLAKAYQSGTVSKQALGAQFALVTERVERDIVDYRERALAAQRQESAQESAPLGLLSAAHALKQQVEQRLAIIEARIRYERATFAEDIEDLAHDAGNAIENAMSERLQTDKWKDQDVWTSMAETQFGQEAARRVDRAVRRREEVLRLFKEELKLFQSDLRVAHSSIIDRAHHTELAQLMPQVRLGTRFVNAMDSAASMTLKGGTIAVAGTSAAAYLIGSAVVLPFVAPAAPFLVGALAVAGLFKWFTDGDKRKISEIKHKRRAIEDVVRARLTEAAASFNGQLEQLEWDYRQTAAALLQPILLDAEAAQQLAGMHQRIAARIVDQTEATIKKLSLELADWRT